MSIHLMNTRCQHCSKDRSHGVADGDFDSDGTRGPGQVFIVYSRTLEHPGGNNNNFYL